MDKLITAIILLLAHAPVVRIATRFMKQGKYPRVVDFGALSIALYSDLGLVSEALGLDYANPLLPSFFDGEEWHQILTLTILIFAPYIYFLGARFTSPENQSVDQTPSVGIRSSRKVIFYVVILGLALLMGIWGFDFYVQDPLGVRIRLRELNLPLNLVLLFPTYSLAYFVRQKDATTRTGIFLTALLTVSSLMAVLPLSGRTPLLLPTIILLLFSIRLSTIRLAVVLVVGSALAVVLLPLYSQPARWGRKTDLSNIEWKSQLQHVLFQDFYRANVTNEVLERMALIDTNVLSYPMSGYVYSLLYYVPRSMAPFKGRSTAIHFAADYLGNDVEMDPVFGFGHSAIDEIILNAGLLFLLPGLIIYGMIMGALDRLSLRVTSLTIPTRLAALWSGGYVSSVLIHFFGSMLLVCLLLHAIFSEEIKLGRQHTPN